MAIENVTKHKKVFPVRAPSNVVLDPTRQIKRAPKNKKCFHDETCFERMGVFPVCAPSNVVVGSGVVGHESNVSQSPGYEAPTVEGARRERYPN